ncbi:hypothetical protein HK103_004180 [Boothiomyces macroporosus]|uniref:EF-hand domain-containing protein n=1 Tax=Boothiomyces macroporosus TaxID=261099 RepID=A0AAD5UH07_9FUNG|nr:hypothetical protein HK103_004180 [Boothiomyces macroporosus]
MEAKSGSHSRARTPDITHGRKSIRDRYALHRKMSVAHPAQELDEETIKIFFSTHGITPTDLERGFDLISSDKKKIYPADVKKFAEKYFSDLPEEALNLISSWKEDVTKEQMSNLLLNKNLMSSPYEAAYKVYITNWQWMTTEEIKIGPKTLKRLVRKLNPHHLPYKNDIKSLLKKYDADQDGHVGLEDFKRMTLI